MPLVQSNELFFDTGLHSYFGFSGGTRRDTGCLFSSFLKYDYPIHSSTKFQSNEQQEEKRGQTDFSYYDLYLLDYLRNNRFEQATDTAFIRERADRAAETYERARLDGYPAEGAQELAMNILLRGLHYSKHAILREVVESEFADDVPEDKQEGFIAGLLSLVDAVFSIYDLSDDNFALSPDYDLLRTELTGAVVLYIEEYGV